MSLIGFTRRALMVRGTHRWNGWVREATAWLEQSWLAALVLSLLLLLAVLVLCSALADFVLDPGGAFMFSSAALAVRVKRGKHWLLDRLDAVPRVLAYFLPRRLVYHALMRAWYHATSGKWSNEEVPAVTMHEVAQRWTASNEPIDIAWPPRKQRAGSEDQNVGEAAIRMHGTLTGGPWTPPRVDTSKLIYQRIDSSQAKWLCVHCSFATSDALLMQRHREKEHASEEKQAALVGVSCLPPRKPADC